MHSRDASVTSSPRLVAGLDTRALTERLFISRHTVQDHLKSIFPKIGIHSRRQLLASFNALSDGR